MNTVPHAKADRSLETHLCERIAATPVIESPFPHQYVESVFPEAFYRELLTRLPDNEAYRTIGETGTLTSNASYRERLIVDLKALARTGSGRCAVDRASDLAFWSGFAASILGVEFHHTLLACYQRWIAQRFGEDAMISTTSQARLVRDLTNYSLGPHTDQPHKLLSLLFYLPADARLPHLGTSIYEPLQAGLRCAGGPHYPFERFRRVSTMRFVPNALFVFFKNDVSFHGVEPVREAAVRRDAIQYNVYVTKTVREARGIARDDEGAPRGA